MNVLVDSSVWIDFFRGSDKVGHLDVLIEEDLICTNDLILAELVPLLRIKRQRKLVALLQTIQRLPMDIDWNEIVDFQIKCIRSGINQVGIPDLMIAQNAIQQGATIYALDKHFALMGNSLPLALLEPSK